MSDASPPAPSESVLTKKLGPLPTWGWMGVGLALVLAWRVWSGRSSAKEKSDATDSTNTVTSGYKLPSNIPPQFTNVDERANFGNTFNNQVTDSNNTTSSSSTVTNPAPVVVAPPVAVPVPTPPAPNGHYVTVIKYHKHDTDRFGIPSTVYGIAQETYGKGSLWKSIWNDPKNAALVSKRKKPENIQTGDKFWVTDMSPAPTSATS